MTILKNVKMRVLSEKDLDAVVEIDKKVFGKRRREFWKRKIAYSDIYPRPALAAEVDGKVVGFILGFVYVGLCLGLNFNLSLSTT